MSTLTEQTGMKTRGQRKKDSPGTNRLKRQLEELQREAAGFIERGEKINYGVMPKQNSEEMWEMYMQTRGDGEVKLREKVGKLEDSNEKGCFSAVESGYKEPRTYEAMMKRLIDKREKWLDGVEK